MGQQPDPNNDDYKMDWVLPMTKEERCACTKIILGGVNIDLPASAAEDHHFYRDDLVPFENNRNITNLRKLLECPDVEVKLAFKRYHFAMCQN